MRRLALASLLVFGCADPTVKQPYQERDLTADEIREKLKSPDFKVRLEGSKQIDKLEAEEKLRVLLVLADDAQASTRLLAVKKLAKIDDPRAKKKLESMAQADPDPDVKSLAAESGKKSD